MALSGLDRKGNGASVADRSRRMKVEEEGEEALDLAHLAVGVMQMVTTKIITAVRRAHLTTTVLTMEEPTTGLRILILTATCHHTNKAIVLPMTTRILDDHLQIIPCLRVPRIRTSTLTDMVRQISRPIVMTGVDHHHRGHECLHLLVLEVVQVQLAAVTPGAQVMTVTPTFRHIHTAILHLALRTDEEMIDHRIEMDPLDIHILRRIMQSL